MTSLRAARTWITSGHGVATGLVVGATCVAGATEHGSALLLRAVAIAACIAWWPKSAARAHRLDLALPVLGMMLTLLGAAVTPVGGAALQDVVRAGLVSALFLAVLLGVPGRFDAVAITGAAVVLVHGPWAVVQRFAGAARGSGGFFDPNDLAALLAPMLIIALEQSWQTRAPPRKPWLAVAAAAAAGLLATGSRGGLLAATAGVALWALSRLRQHPRVWTRAWKIRWAMLATAMLAGGGLLTAQRWTTRHDPQAFDRLSIWRRTIEVAWEHPWGVGLGAYADAMRLAGVPTSGLVRYARSAHHAHSEPLHLWAELGWPGLVLVLLVVTYVALRCWRSVSLHDALARTAVAVTFALPALLSASLHVPVVALLGAAWMGDVVRGSAREAPSAAWLPRRGAAACVLVMLGALAVPSWVSHVAREQAATLRDAGDLDGAYTWAEWSAAAAPWSPAAAMLVESLAYLRTGDPAASAEALLVVAERFPQSPLPLPRAAWLVEQIARQETSPERAAQIWKEAAQLRALASARTPYDVLERVAWGEAAYASGDVLESKEIFLGAVELEPSCARALAWLARLHHEAGDAEQAREFAERARAAAARAPDYPEYAGRVLSLPPTYATMVAAL